MKKKNYNNPYENVKSKKLLYQINSLLTKFNIYTSSDILKYILKTTDDIYKDKIVEYVIDIDLDRLSDHIVILFKINKSKFLIIGDKNMLLMELFDQIKNIINVNKNTSIYINGREFDYDDCIERKIINLFKNSSYYEGVYNIEIKNKNVEIQFCELLKNIKNNNIQPIPILPHNITISNDILKILSKRSYNKVVEENKDYLLKQNILFENLEKNQNIPETLKNIIETKKIQNYTKVDLLKIIDENKDINIELLNKILNDLFGGKVEYNVSLGSYSGHISYNFIGLVIKYFYEDKTNNKKIINEENNSRLKSVRSDHQNMIVVDFINKQIKKHFFEYDKNLLFPQNMSGIDVFYLRDTKYIIRIYNNLFKIIDDKLNIDVFTTENDFTKKINMLKNLNNVIIECISYLTYVTINNSYCYSLFNTNNAFGEAMKFCNIHNNYLNYKFLENKYFWKHLIQNIKLNNIFYYCLCNYDVYGKYIYSLFFEDYYKNVKNKFENIKNEIEKYNLNCIQSIFSGKFKINYDDKLLASFLIFSSEEIPQKYYNEKVQTNTNKKVLKNIILEKGMTTVIPKLDSF